MADTPMTDIDKLMFMLRQQDDITKTLVQRYERANDTLNAIAAQEDELRRMRQETADLMSQVEQAMIVRYEMHYAGRK